MQRTGSKNDPAFRVVVAEHTVGPKSGKIVEKVGSHYPRTKETILNSDRIKHWLSVGAQPSPTVFNLLVSAGVIEGKKQSVVSLTNKRRKKLGDKLIEQEQKKREAEEKAAQEVQAKKDAEAAAAAAKEVTEVTPEETSEEPAA